MFTNSDFKMVFGLSIIGSIAVSTTPDTLVKGISKNDFLDLLNLATKESFFTFNNKFYIQVDGVAMGSPLGPILANLFFHIMKKSD